MTTILAKQFENGFIIAADSQFTSGGTPYRHPKMEKISRVGELWIAGAGNSNACDIIQNTWTPPKIPANCDMYKYIMSHIIPSMKATLDKHGIKYDSSDDADKDNSSDFILGFDRQLYVISDWAILLSETGIYGIGSGSAYGIGALAAGATIKKAMAIACEWDTNSGGPIQVVKEGVTRA